MMYPYVERGRQGEEQGGRDAYKLHFILFLRWSDIIEY
jgi:hypothetical protein